MREVPLYPVGGARAGRGLMKMVWCLEQGQTLQPAAAQPQGEDKVPRPALSEERVFTKLTTSDRKLDSSREGSK